MMFYLDCAELAGTGGIIDGGALAGGIVSGWIWVAGGTGTGGTLGK
ncbi:hypothetical protein PATSB16_42840 [Pandoraea thiooxydans]|nr:hypothetical protein [Pandoraea thiooxydans]APR97618.1 hypothetical protein PATSB16_42840 [Pandoraea thiooxydans]